MGVKMDVFVLWSENSSCTSGVMVSFPVSSLSIDCENTPRGERTHLIQSLPPALPQNALTCGDNGLEADDDDKDDGIATWSSMATSISTANSMDRVEGDGDDGFAEDELGVIAAGVLNRWAHLSEV